MDEGAVKELIMSRSLLYLSVVSWVILYPFKFKRAPRGPQVQAVLEDRRILIIHLDKLLAVDL